MRLRRLPLAFSFCSLLLLGAANAASAPDLHRDPAANQVLAEEAINSLSSGIRYRFGGTDPETGLDCSAFVARIYKEAVGGNLPRTAREISEVGEHISLRNIAPGDLIFFGKGKGKGRRRIAHVGIYVGGEKFVHASRKHGVIYESALNEPYWQKRFNGIRRLPAVQPHS